MDKSPYLRFLIATNNIWAETTPTERSVLEVVIKGTGSAFKVQDILEMREIASPATIHKALSKLVAKDYLKLITSEEDGRVKFVQLSKKGEWLVAKLNQTLNNSFN